MLKGEGIYPAPTHKRINELDAKLANLQKSTRATFPIMVAFHDILRHRFRWYYDWHMKSWSSTVHWMALTGYTAVALLLLIALVFKGPARNVMASTTQSWSGTTEWANWKMDNLQVTDRGLELKATTVAGHSIKLAQAEATPTTVDIPVPTSLATVTASPSDQVTPTSEATATTSVEVSPEPSPLTSPSTSAVNQYAQTGSATLTFSPDEVVDWLKSEAVEQLNGQSIKKEFSSDNILWTTDIQDLANADKIYLRLTLSTSDTKVSPVLSKYAINYSRLPLVPANLKVEGKVSSFGLTEKFSAGAFQDPDGDSHMASQWQVSKKSGDFQSPVIDETVKGKDLTAYTLKKKLEKGNYYFRVRYQDTVGAWSPWSLEAAFRINDRDLTFLGEGEVLQYENEEIDNRSETTKTIDNKNGTKTLVASTGIMHYKENYSNDKEAWKDINSSHMVDNADYVLFDRLPSTVKVYKNKIGYEIVSRKTGEKYKVELQDLDGNPQLVQSKGSNGLIAWADINSSDKEADNKETNKIASWFKKAFAQTNPPEDGNLKFEFEIGEYGVRLWKTIEGENAPKNFEWKVTKEGSGDTLRFRDEPEAFEVSTNGQADLKKPVEIMTEKTGSDSSFTWKETAPQTDLKIDTDVTYYPDYDPGTNTVDGMVGNPQPAPGGTWAAICGAETGAAVSYNNANTTIAQWMASGGMMGETWIGCARGFFLFKTDDLDGKTITSATFSVYGSGTTDMGTAKISTNIYEGTALADISNTTLALADFDATNSTALSDTAIAIGSWNTSGYNNYSLNAAGLAAIKKTGITSIVTRSTNDATNTAPVFSANALEGVSSYMAEQANTNQDPKLVVTYSSGISVAGTFYDTDESTALTSKSVAMRVNNGSESTATTDPATGAFSFSSITAAAGDTITIYSKDGTKKANTVTVTDGATNITGAHLYADHVGVRSDNGTNALTILDMVDWDNDDDSTNMLFTATDASPDTLVLETGIELYIFSSETFTPGGSVTAHDMDLNGTFVPSSNTINISGSWDATDGTLTNTDSTINFTSTSTGETILDGGNNWNNVTFNGADGGWSFSDATVLAGDLTVTAGTLSGTNNITVNGGDVTGNGIINLTGGIFLVDTAGNFGGDTNWTFYDLTFGDGVGETTTTKTGIGGPAITHVLTIAANQTLDAGDDTWLITGTGTPFVKTGTLTPNASTFMYEVAENTTVTAADYYNLILIDPSFTLVTAEVGMEGANGIYSQSGTYNSKPAYTNATYWLFYTQAGMIGPGWAVSTSKTDTLADIEWIRSGETADIPVEGMYAPAWPPPPPYGGITVTQNPKTLTLASGTFNIANDLTLGDSVNTTVIDADTNDPEVNVSRDLTITANTTFETSSATSLDVARNFSNSGTFNHNSGTVNLTGAGGSTQVISGSTTFNNLSATATADRTIKFASGTTQTIEGTWTVTGAENGADDHIITLDRNDTNNAQWDVNPTAWNVSYVNVSNSHNNAVSLINPSNSTDGGGNTNWFAAPPTAPSNVSEITPSTDGFTVQWTDNSSDETNFNVYISTVSNADCSLATYPGTPDYEPAAGATSQAVSGKSVNTQYCAKVTAENSAGESAAAYAASPLYTLANVPAAPSVSSPSNPDVLTIVINTNSNPASTEYAISCDNDATFLNYTTNACEAIADDANHWRTYANWGGAAGFNDSGLDPNTEHTYKVKARNGDEVNTVLSASDAAYTYANVPGAPTVDTPTTTSLKITIEPNGNPAITTFGIKNVTENLWVQADGSLGVGAVFQTVVQWNATGYVVNTGLTPETTYTYQVQATNGDALTTDFSPEGSNTTLALGPDISGVCKKFDATTNCANAETVKVAVNGVLQVQTGTTAGGTWTISSVTAVAGDVITVFVDGVGNALEATAVTKYDGTGDITGMALYEEHLTLGSVDNPSLTNADLKLYDNSASSDEDIFFDVDNANNNLTLDSLNQSSQETLDILSGATYRPDNENVTTTTTVHFNNAGTYTNDANNINLTGNWTNSGAYTAGNGNVNFAGANSSTQNITGNTTFYNFTASAADNTLGRTLTFDAGSTTTVTNLWTITGGVGKLITLNSDDDSGIWFINPSAWTVSYVDVAHSTNQAVTIINPTNSTDSDNNTNWFYQAPSVTLANSSTWTSNADFTTFSLDNTEIVGDTLKLSANTGATYLTDWGSNGTGQGQFKGPRAVAVDATGNVYVADYTNNRIQKFDGNGTYLTAWGTTGTGNGQFKNPTGVAVDSSGNVYVSDWLNNRVQKFSSTGTYITKWGTLGAGNGQLYHPAGLTVDASNNVYVTDFHNYRIQKFTSTGTYVTKWGAYGTGNGQFNGPRGIEVDATGNVYVADYGNNRIQKFTSSGAFVTKWGTYGTANGQFKYPSSVTVDSSGNFYVTDYNNNRVQKFDSSGTYLTKWGSSGTGDGRFKGPSDLAIDSSGNIFVADYSNDRIQKFSDDTSGTATKSGLNSGISGSDWYKINWATTSLPAGTLVKARLRASDTFPVPLATEWSDYVTSTGSDIHLPGGTTHPSGQYADIEFTLASTVGVSSIPILDSGTVSYTASAVPENGGTATISATLSAVTNQNVVVSLASSGVAVKDTDYSLSAETITVPTGSLTSSITLTALNEADDEENEVAYLDISSIVGGTEDGTQQAAVTITDNDYTITATAGAGGTITPSGAVSVEGGTEKTFAIAADPGYDLSDVTVTGSASVGAVSSFTFHDVLANQTIDATFAAKNQYIAVGASGCSINPAGPVETVVYGTNKTFTITPDDNFAISDVLVDNVSQGAIGSYEFVNVTADHDLFAICTINTYEIEVTASAGGTVAPAGPIVEVVAGANQTFTITPDAGYSVASVLDNGTAVTLTNGAYTMTNVQSPHALVVTFESAPTVSLSVNNETMAENGGTSKVTATLSDTYSKDVTVTLGFAGTATNVSDYTRSAATISIGAGNTTGYITLAAVDDLLKEDSETIVVSISDVANGTEDGTQTETVTITDDEPTSILPPTNFTGRVGDSEVSLSWTNPVSAYFSYIEIYRSLTSGSLGERIATTGSNTYRNTGLTNDTTYYYTLKAVDTVGNVSQPTSQLALTPTNIADNEVPTKPLNLRATNIKANQLTLIWNASTDNVGVLGYKLYNSDTNTLIATTSSTEVTLNDLSPNTLYHFFVESFDAQGNISQKSNTLEVRTLNGDQISIEAYLILSGVPSEVNAGESFSQGVKVIAVDAGGAKVNSYLGSVYFKSSDTKANLKWNKGNPYGFSAADEGSHTFSGNDFTLNSRGNQTLIVTDERVNATADITVIGNNTGATAIFNKAEETVNNLFANLSNKDFNTSTANVSTAIIAATTLLLLVPILMNAILSLVGIWPQMLYLATHVMQFFGIRKRRHPWGTVFNSQTGQPIPYAIVKIFDKEYNRLLETEITDSAGRFGFLVKKGVFYINVQKTGYVFPPAMKISGYFDSIYAGGNLNIDKDKTVIVNIPIDPEIKESFSYKLLVVAIKMSKLMNRLRLALLVLGSMFALILVITDFNYFYVLSLAFYFFIAILEFLRTKRSRPYGVVSDVFGKPVQSAIVRVFEKRSNRLVETDVTDADGRFKFLVNPGVYYLTAVKPDYIDFKSHIMYLEKEKTMVSVNIKLKKLK